MSANALSQAERVATQAAVDLCWSQWVGLGSLAAPIDSRRPQSVIDPEALLLLSISVSEHERRLKDFVAWWARAGSALTSLHRLKSVAGRFPDPMRKEGVSLFATLAAAAGDRRWTRNASDPRPDWGRADKGPTELELIEPSALWPRLRAGLGVGAKADLLVFLLGLRGAWASAKVISFATGYSSVTIRKAASEMALARLIREMQGRPVEYLAPPTPWAAVLELNGLDGQSRSTWEPPAWHFWSEIGAFLAHVIAFRGWADQASASPRVISSRARDLVERHAKAFNFDGIPVPSPDGIKAGFGTEALLETVNAVSDWARMNV